MIDARTMYIATCDGCGAKIGSFDERAFFGPQDVTQELLQRYQWTAFEDIHHCSACPPICAGCGLDESECDCKDQPEDAPLGHPGDSAYVSRGTLVTDGDGSALAARAYPTQALQWDDRPSPAVVSFNTAPAAPDVPVCKPWGDCEFDPVDEYCRRCDVPEVEEHRRGEG